MQAWKKISQRTKNIGFRSLVFKLYQMPDGSEREFTTYGKTGAQDVAIIALTSDNKVVVARQFRPGPEMIFDELPGGSVDLNEDLSEAVQRELLEETGYKVTRLELLGEVTRDAYSNNRGHYFIGFEATKSSEPSLDPGEFVEADLISVEQLFDNARKGKMSDSVAVMLAYEQLK